jgi:hypothetical protein
LDSVSGRAFDPCRCQRHDAAALVAAIGIRVRTFARSFVRTLGANALGLMPSNGVDLSSGL